MKTIELPVKEIVTLYESGVNAPKIAEQYNCSSDKIRRLLKKEGIQLRHASENNKKYSCDDHYFDNIDTEYKAY